MMRWIKMLAVLVVLGALAGGGVWYFGYRSSGAGVSFRIAAVKRGDLLATINSTGTLEPEEVVDVGAQVAGQINEFGRDANGKAIDYGSFVEANMVLARIDDSLYAADVASATAQAQLAAAGLVRAQADLKQMEAKLDQAQRDWDRAQKLGPEALAPTTFDAYKAGYEVAKANVAVGEAAIVQAQATKDQSAASLVRVRRNLGYCTITSPVKGVIIDRRVNIGQTVVASLNAPSLFLIAKDLKRMEVWVAVNEADIGNIYSGQPVSFKVDAFPEEVFRGEVGTVRYNATMTQNVVTYTVEVTTDNSSGRLLPYLTASVDFETARRGNVLTVPNAALRWTPQLEQIAPEFRQEATSLLQRRGGRGQATSGPAADSATAPATRPGRSAAGGPGTRPGPSTARPGAGRGVVWALQGKSLQPISVRVGITDGINTEVQGQDLKEGLEIVIGEQQQQSSGSKTVNPFTPQMPRRGGGAGGSGTGGGTGGGARGAGAAPG